MENLQIQIIHAFADGAHGGNPAGIVLNADTLSHKQKLTIAQKVGLSETAFVSASEVADIKLEFFTPAKQIPHCGHATIATFSFLKQSGYIRDNTSSKETIDGLRQIYFDGDMAFMEQQAPTFSSLLAEDRSSALQALGLKPADLLDGLDLQIVDTGNAFLIIPVKNETILKNIHPDLKVIESLSLAYKLIGVYVFTYPEEESADATARMFAPYYGIPEEAATGMAAGPLACYLDEFNPRPTTTYTITQGLFMSPPSPSRIFVILEKNNIGIQKLFVGGSAYKRKTSLKIALS